MKFLFISNFYPPYDRGGYEKHCCEVANGLRARGHKVSVLTSRYGVPSAMQDQAVLRSLFLESDIKNYSPARFFLKRQREERHNVRVMLSIVSAFEPEAIVFWGMWNLSRRLPALAERMHVSVVYWIGDLWPISPGSHTQYWRLPTRRRSCQPLKSLAAMFASVLLRLDDYPLELRFEHVVCGSHFLKERLSAAGLPLQYAEVVMCGIDTQRFRTSIDWQQRYQELRSQCAMRLLYVGAATPQKGVHTAIDAMVCLARRCQKRETTLTIVGTGIPSYVQELRKRVKGNGLSNRVSFVGPASYEALPALMRRHDVLVFPSIIEEGFGRVLVEAMAAGLVVIGTGVGGSGEILQDGVNGLCFQPEDATQLAAQIERLGNDADLYVRLAVEGQRTALNCFDLSQMVDGIDRYLTKVVSTSGQGKTK